MAVATPIRTGITNLMIMARPTIAEEGEVRDNLVLDLPLEDKNPKLTTIGVLISSEYENPKLTTIRVLISSESNKDENPKLTTIKVLISSEKYSSTTISTDKRK